MILDDSDKICTLCLGVMHRRCICVYVTRRGLTPALLRSPTLSSLRVKRVRRKLGLMIFYCNFFCPLYRLRKRGRPAQRRPGESSPSGITASAPTVINVKGLLLSPQSQINYLQQLLRPSSHFFLCLLHFIFFT